MVGEEGYTHYVNVSIQTSMRKYNNEIHARKINERFGIIGGPLQLGEIAREFFSPAEEVIRSVKP